MKKSIFLLLWGLATSNAISQCPNWPEYNVLPPRLDSVKAQSRALKDSLTGIITYSYSLHHGSSSTVCVSDMEIDVIYPANSLDLSSSGLVDYPRYVNRDSSVMPDSFRVMPIGIPTLPRYKGIPSAWGARFSPRGTIGWSSAGHKLQLVPGGQLTGIVLTSYGLPGIRSCAVEPSWHPLIDTTFVGEVPDSITFYIDSVRNSLTWKGFTVGPTAPPLPFNGINFLDTIKSYINQSRSLGWITTQATADKYTALVDSARAKLQANKFALTRAKLDTVVLYANQDSSSTLTSEAYALLRFNTEYLLTQLPRTFTLSLTTAGSGTVQKNPDQPSYDSASTVTLTPVPATGYLFTRWSGTIQPSDSFSNPLSVTMNSNKTITANFVLSTYTIVATAGTHGSISPSGNIVVNYGSNKTFTMTPVSGWQVSDVLVDSVSVGAVSSYTFTNVTANHTITAYFVSSCSCCELPGELDQMTFTDTKGQQKILFLRNAGLPYAEGVSDSSVIAVTKKGTLNAKFKSGQLVQTVAPKNPIQDVFITVQSAAYPLKLSWNVKSKNKTSYWYIDSKGKKTALTGKGNLNINNAAGGAIYIQASAEIPC